MFNPPHAEYFYVGVDEVGNLERVAYRANGVHLVAIAGVALKVAADKIGGDFSDAVHKIADITIETEKNQSTNNTL